MSVRLFFALLDMVAVLFIWYQTFPKAGNRILHCAVSCVFGAVIVYSLRSTPRALDILCLAVSWELMEKYIKSRDIRFLFGFPFLGVCIANLHGALWPCAIMLPLAALLDSKLDPNARAALAVTILLTIASAMLNPYGLDVLSLPFKTIGTSDIATVAVPELKPLIVFLRRETCKTWESAVQREDRSHQMSLKEKRDTVSRRVSLNEINHDFDVR